MQDTVIAGTPTPTKVGPDFIIAGAPKCGTTSLHFILDQHPDIGLPQDEVNYFDADDPLNWPDLFFVRNGALDWRNPDPDVFETATWYRNLFAPMADRTFLGEDSTEYLFSPAAPYRIRERLPDARIIFVLRDPVKRAYSQYWHEMKMMRATMSFERAITSMPKIVGQSTYAPHLRHWHSVLGANRIHVMVFEDFLADRQAEMDKVADFIGANRFDVSAYQLWFNKTLYPSSPKAQMMLNQIGRHIAKLRYRPHMRLEGRKNDRLLNKLYQVWFHRVNPILFKSERAPMMRDDTRAFLNRHLRDRNQGLDDMLNRDLAEVWPSWAQNSDAGN